MDSKRFFKHIGKYKWYLIIIPIIAVGVTYYMVKDLPKQYVSEALIATGFVDQSKQISGEPELDFFKTNQLFTNTIEKIKMRKVTNQLSYSLIIHDLEADPQHRFKKYSKLVDSLSPEKKAAAIAAFKEKYATREILTLADKERYDLYQLIASMGYNIEALSKNLSVSHADGSDFISIDYVSQDPQLSAFVVNTLSKEFIAAYTRDVDINQDANIALLDSIARKKEEVMNDKAAALKDFKMRNGIVNLDKESSTVYAQMSADEDLKAKTLRDIQSSQGAMKGIDAQLAGKENYSSGSSVADNREIISLREQIKSYNDRYINGNFNVAYKRKADSLTAILNQKTAVNSDANIIDPKASRASQIQRRNDLKVELDKANSSLKSINDDLADLTAKYDKMMPYNANIGSLQTQYDLALKEFTDAENRYNQTRTEQNIGPKITISQLGLINPPEPSKKVIFVILSGFGSFAICFMAILIIFFIDSTITTSKQLANVTHMPVVGHVSYIDMEGRSMKHIWDNTETESYVAFKNLLRSLRLEISHHMDADGSKILGITSLVSGEGKSLIASGLSYAFAMTGKKVLLVGGETQMNQSLTVKASPSNNNFETFLIKRELKVEDLITVLNKNDNDSSLLEMQNSTHLKSGFEVLKNDFDLIIIDINSLSNLNIAKEWLLFTEKNVAVFEAGRALTDHDKELVAYMKSQPGFIGWIMNKIKLN